MKYLFILYKLYLKLSLDVKGDIMPKNFKRKSV